MASAADGTAALFHRVMAVHEDAPARGLQERREHLYRRRFARAVRAKEGEDFSFAHLERNVVHGRQLTKLLHEVLDSDHGAGHCFHANRLKARQDGNLPPIGNRRSAQIPQSAASAQPAQCGVD